MRSTLRYAASRILSFLAFGATLLAADAASAIPTADDTGTLDSKLNHVLGAPGGLTSDVRVGEGRGHQFRYQREAG